MEPPLIYVFDEFTTAERAHEELLSCGFERAAVRLTVRDDEAGPPQGNFTVGDSPAVAGGRDYQKTYANPVQRASCMLTITPIDPTQAKYAIALLARYGICEGIATPAPSVPPVPAR